MHIYNRIRIFEGLGTRVKSHICVHTYIYINTYNFDISTRIRMIGIESFKY